MKLRVNIFLPESTAVSLVSHSSELETQMQIQMQIQMQMQMRAKTEFLMGRNID